VISHFISPDAARVRPGVRMTGSATRTRSRATVAAVLACASGAAHAAGVDAGSATIAVLALLLAVVLTMLHRARLRASDLGAQASEMQDLLTRARSEHDEAAAEHEAERSDLAARLEQAAQREAAHQVALRAAQNDTLTKLPTRIRMLEDITRELASARRRQTRMAVLFVDLDDFKRINDTLGHAAGDELVRQAGERLTACVRSDDALSYAHEPAGQDVARVGGDEFVLLLRDTGESAGLSSVATRLLEAFRKPFAIGGFKVQSSISIGIACFPRDGDSAETLLNHADMAMYRAKEAGKDGFEFFSPAMTAAATRRMLVENGLRKAVERGEFVLHYQPKVAPRSHRVLGAEALLRWNSPEHGLVSPETFIGIAEDTGLIAPIGEWAMVEACRQMRSWLDMRLHPMQVAVNVSSAQFRDDNVLTAVVRAIKESGLPPHLLQLEVTENLFMKNMATARNSLSYVRGLGVTVALDDFGTGFSSLGYLRQLPIDALKIDRSFVHHLGTKAEDREIVVAILTLARALGMKTIAEGVSTIAQHDVLSQMACDEMQGYLFAPPVDATTMTQILRIGSITPGSLDNLALPKPTRPGELYIPNESGRDDAQFDSKSTMVAPLGMSTI